MKKNSIITVLVIGIAVNLGLNIFNVKSTKKVAYVRSQDLVYAFDGMKEMQLKFQEKSKTWEANIDTLKMEYQKSVTDYQQQMNQLSVEERADRENLLYMQQNNLAQYAENIKIKAQEEENEMLEGVLNQVNTFVEDYGQKNNYDLILGTTMSGSILYGNDVIDITQEIITAINNDYNGR